MSFTTAYRVLALRLTVPRQPWCSCELEIVMGGRSINSYAFDTCRAMRAAMRASVARGRWGPCCSKLPTGKTATSAAREASSGLVAVGQVSSRALGSSDCIAHQASDVGRQSADLRLPAPLVQLSAKATKLLHGPARCGYPHGT